MLLRVFCGCSGEFLPLEEHHSQNRGNDEVDCYDSESFWDWHIERREGCSASWTEGSHGGAGWVGYCQDVSDYLGSVGQDEPWFDLDEG